MFCPVCKCEYRSGFTFCADCNANLVESLTATLDDSPADDSETIFEKVWSGHAEDECVFICEQLQASQIGYKVVATEPDHAAGRNQNFDILVPRDASNQARQIIATSGLESLDLGEDLGALELPDDGDEAPGRELDRDWEPGRWDPEEATVQVWSEDAPHTTWMIEMSLQEHHIHTRTDTAANGSLKLFVLPADEMRAREIVHEIQEGAPPS